MPAKRYHVMLSRRQRETLMDLTSSGIESARKLTRASVRGFLRSLLMSHCLGSSLRRWNPNALALGGKTALLERTKTPKYI